MLPNLKQNFGEASPKKMQQDYLGRMALNGPHGPHFSPFFRGFFKLFLGFMRSPVVLDEPPTNIKKIIFGHFYNFGFLVISGCFFNPVAFSLRQCFLA